MLAEYRARSGDSIAWINRSRDGRRYCASVQWPIHRARFKDFDTLDQAQNWCSQQMKRIADHAE
jgi:hypothetical protein